MFNLSPKEDKFYKMFIEAAKNVNEAAITLRETMDNLDDRQCKFKEIERLEHKGDQLVHNILEELNNSFITPIDREDIYSIAKEMDDIVDYIEATMNRFIMFDVTHSTEEAKVLCNMIIDATREVIDLMGELENMGKSKKLSQKIIAINRIEDEADTYFRQTVSDLFKNNKDVLEVIKWREIYEFLERTIDNCESVANIVEGVVMKNA